MLRNEATYKLPLDKTTYRAIKMHTGTTIARPGLDLELKLYPF